MSENKNGKEIYRTYLEHMRHNESNVMKFLATLFTAIGGFYLVIKNQPNDSIWLLIASIGASIILFWGILYTLSMSYTHRYLQIIMWYYEKDLKLHHCKDWDPTEKFTDWSCKESMFWEIAPEPYKSHLIGFFISIGFIWFAFLQIKICLRWYWDILILFGIFFLEWIIIATLTCCYISKIRKLAKKEKWKIDNA